MALGVRERVFCAYVWQAENVSEEKNPEEIKIKPYKTVSF